MEQIQRNNWNFSHCCLEGKCKHKKQWMNLSFRVLSWRFAKHTHTHSVISWFYPTGQGVTLLCYVVLHWGPHADSLLVSILQSSVVAKCHFEPLLHAFTQTTIATGNQQLHASSHWKQENRWKVNTCIRHPHYLGINIIYTNKFYTKLKNRWDISYVYISLRYKYVRDKAMQMKIKTEPTYMQNTITQDTPHSQWNMVVAASCWGGGDFSLAGSEKLVLVDQKIEESMITS